MGINIEKISSLNLTEKEIIIYGETAKVYRTMGFDFCYKKYKNSL